MHNSVNKLVCECCRAKAPGGIRSNLFYCTNVGKGLILLMSTWINHHQLGFARFAGCIFIARISGFPLLVFNTWGVLLIVFLDTNSRVGTVCRVHPRTHYFIFTIINWYRVLRNLNKMFIHVFIYIRMYT